MAETEGIEVIVNDELLENVRAEVLKFKSVLKVVFDARRETGLCTLRFHLLDHFVEQMNRLESSE